MDSAYIYILQSSGMDQIGRFFHETHEKIKMSKNFRNSMGNAGHLSYNHNLKPSAGKRLE